MSERATGAIVSEYDRCICDDLCNNNCRACNYSGRDLEEGCIKDPDWEPDDEYLAIRMARIAAIDNPTPPAPESATDPSACVEGGCGL